VIKIFIKLEKQKKHYFFQKK